MIPKKRSSHEPNPSKGKKLHSGDSNVISSLTEAIKALTKESNEPKKNLTEKVIKNCIQIIKESSASVGLSSHDIISLAKIISSYKCGEYFNSKLISFMVPTIAIPFEAVEYLLSLLTSKSSSFTVKAAILEWIVGTFEYIQPKELLHRYYGIFFQFIKYSSLCPYVCHILFLITEKEDVRPLWIRKLKSVEKLMGLQPDIVGLLSLYQLHRPDLVTMNSSSHEAFFKKPKKWTNRLEAIKASNATHRPSFYDFTETNQITAIDDVRQDFVKSSKNIAIPSVKFVNTNENFADKVQFHQMKTFQEIVSNIHKVQLPCRVISLLKYRALRMVLLSKTEPSIIVGIDSWIESTMLKEFVFHKKEKSQSYRDELLKFLVEFSEDIQEGFPCLERVLSQYLIMWNGEEHRSKILSLISRWRLCPFDQLQTMVLDPLKKLCMRSSLFFCCSVINCLTKLIHNMAMIELARYTCASYFHHNTDDDKKMEIYFRSVFPSVIYEQLDILETFTLTIEYVMSLCDVTLRIHNFHPLVFHHVLELYEELNQLQPTFGIPKSFVMSRTIAYNGLLSLDPIIISRICGLLVSYKTLIENIAEEKDYKENLIKAYSNDFISTLWTNEAFKPKTHSLIYNKKAGTNFFKCASLVKGSASALSIVKHPALINYAKTFVSDKQDFNEVFQLTENKNKFVEFLKDKGHEEIHHFWEAFIKKDSKCL